MNGLMNTSTPGANSAAVKGENKGTNTNGAGVLGTHAGSGQGVQGTSVGGTGVHGTGLNGVTGESFIDGATAFGVTGVGHGDGSTGVYGFANTGAEAFGVWGFSSTGFAGVFSGNVSVTGTLSKGGGSFKIDHPLEPETKTLSHSFVESPDMMNVYNGNVTLDSNGGATVELPDYFEALNKDFRYQLTTIGGHAPVYVSREVEKGSFTIAGGVSGLKVSWQVTGIRQDAWANANRIPVAEDKPRAQRGRYLYPQVFGMPASASVDAPRLAAARQAGGKR